MAEKNVQLKEQEIVGQEVVLSDIYPKTDTTSVVDATTGIPLDVKLDYLAELINDKLTRVVNSVNNRTGVVVLDADDVGLGNVDNISFAEMKEWINRAINQAFGNKHLLSFQDYNELAAYLQQNIASAEYAPFYVESWNYEDLHHDMEYRSAIGYITEYNGITSENHRFINTIGSTDESIDYLKGRLKVRLSENEDNLLRLSHNGDDNDGLILTKDDACGFTTFDSLFNISAQDIIDSGSTSGPISGLIIPGATIENDTDENHFPVHVYLNGIHIRNPWITSAGHQGDTNFILRDDWIDDHQKRKVSYQKFLYIRNPLINWEGLGPLLQDDAKIAKELIIHNPTIAHLVYSKATQSESAHYKLYLYTLNQTSSWGLTNDFKDQSTRANVAYDGLLSISTTSESGIQALSDPSHYDLTQEGTSYTYTQPTNNEMRYMNHRFTPDGIDPIYDESNTDTRKGGMFIATDASMCTYSYDDYGLKYPQTVMHYSSDKATNWFANTPYYISGETAIKHKGYMNAPTFVGVNLVKGKHSSIGSKYIPLSGLKIVDSTDLSKHYGSNPNNRAFWWSDLGLKSTSLEDKVKFLSEMTIEDREDFFSNMYVTGGLMVNVGNGLEIVPSNVPDYGENYNTEGKVSVRLGEGFKFDEDGRVTYDSETMSVNGSVANLQAISLIDEHRPQDEEVEFRMNPSTVAPNSVKSINKIKLGDGLLLTIEKEDLYKILVHELTITQLQLFRTKTYSYTVIDANDNTESTVTIDVSSYFSNITEDEHCVTYGDLITGLTNVTDALSVNYHMMETAYRELQSIRDDDQSNCQYSTVDIAHSVTLERLKYDEIASGTTTIDHLTIYELMVNYRERHSSSRPIGDLGGDTSQIEVIDYSAFVTYVNYTDLPILEELTPAQTKFFVHMINVSKAIRQALYLKEIWVDNIRSKTFLDAEYKENSTDNMKLEIALYDLRGDQHQYLSRPDSSGFIAFTLMEMGYALDPIYNATTNQKVFASSLLTLESDPYRILNDDNEHTLCQDFSYKVNPKISELRFGDIIVSNNMLWIFGGTKDNVIGGVVGSIDLIGVDYNNGEHMVDLLNNIDRMVRKHSDYVTKRDAMLKFFSVEELTVYMNNTETKEEILNKTHKDIKLAIRYGKDDEDADLSWRFEDAWEEDEEDGGD